MFTESEIREQIISYLSNEQSFEDFEDWLVVHSRERYLDNPQYIRDVMGQICYLIFQHIENELNEEQLRDALRSLSV
jgi:hypothetical protein